MRIGQAAKVSRRRFVSGLALGAGVAVIGRPLWSRAQGLAANSAVLSGDRFDLTIDPVPVNITGRRRLATGVNGMTPGPVLRFREGDLATIRVTNRLKEPTSIHWHGFRLPAEMDGVPGLSFAGIMPGETFTYRFPVVQSGSFFYHSHSGMQEQTGLYGAALITPKTPEPYAYDRDYAIVLSDWTDEDPMAVMANLKQQNDYYDHHRRTLGDFIADARKTGLGPAWSQSAMWADMRMSPTDIMDVTGATYTFLVNGQPPAANWTALFHPGERVRLRVINAAAMTTFDVRIPGLAMTVVAADGSDVEPVEAEEFRIGPGETFDVIVQPADAAYALFAQAQDRSGWARATLAPRPGMIAAVPPMDPRPLRTMKDMGMGGGMRGMAMGDMGSGKKDSMAGMPGMDMGQATSSDDSMDHMAMPGMAAPMKPPVVNADGADPKTLRGRPSVDNASPGAESRLTEAGDGLDGNGRKVLTYADLRALRPDPDARPPEREIEFHLTGNMQRWIWGFDGKRFSEAGPVHVKLGERVRFVLINDTMMEHPIHLHGFLFQLENGQDDALPLKHTVNVKPNERLSFVYTADAPGHWAFHCHLMFHMESGMFRTVVVA